VIRLRYDFVACGYVVMPEHAHLLVSEPKKALLSKAIQALKLSVSVQSRERPFWQARYYDFNVHNEEKRVEKIRYMHRNPVKRGLVEKPEDCHPTGEGLSAGIPVGLVQLPALRDRHRRDRGD
jgi:putative transposase